MKTSTIKFTALRTMLLSVVILALTSCSSLEKKEVKRLPMRGPSILKMLANGHGGGYENAVNIKGFIEVSDPAATCLLKEQVTIEKEKTSASCKPNQPQGNFYKTKSQAERIYADYIKL